MLITVFCAPRDRPETTFALDVSPELELRDFVALCELESGVPAGEIQIMYTEQPLIDLTRALGNYGVKDGDVVVLRQADRRPPPTQPAFPGLPHIDFRSITVPGSSSSGGQRAAPRQPQQQPTSPPAQPPAPLAPAPQPSTPSASRSSGSGSSLPGLDDPALLQQMLLSNPHELSLLKERNPPLAEALLSGDLERFTKVLGEQQQDRARREQERIRLLTADPFDLEAQAKIEEDIRQHNVEENMTIAMEEAPESFGQVVMLYINCIVNGHPVKAFVDSGAQMTIMSQACAERCNIMRLVDRRWAGIAKGVGTQKIIGRVHLAQVQIEGIFLPCSFSILEDQPMDMLLGLDMLKRHQCSIDLKKNVLLIGTTATETRFLPEAELPECARLAYGPEGREDARPEEMADRELAEALQRSIQESDTADGQTTSPDPPPFLPPATPDHPPPLPSSSWDADGSAFAPPPPQPPPEPSRDPPAPQGPPEPLPSPAQDTTQASDRQALPSAASPTSVPTQSPAPSTEDPPALPPPGDQTGPHAPAFQEPAGRAAASVGIECDSDGMRSPAEPSAHQPMEQEPGDAPPTQPSPVPLLSLPADAACPTAATDDDTDLGDPACAEMISPPCEAEGDAAGPPERAQPEGEHCPNTTPSLASALRELHQLLVSNGCKRTQDAPAPPVEETCSPVEPCPSTEPRLPTETCRQNADGLDDGCRSSTPKPADPEPLSAAIEPSSTEPSADAKPHHHAAAAAAAGAAAETESAGSEGQGPASHEGLVSREGPEAAEGLEDQPCPDGSWESRAEGQEESSCGPRPQTDLEVREPPEGQQGRGVADGRASGTCTPDGLGALQGPEAPPVAPSLPPGPEPPAPSRDQFPTEHLRRIQAEGFSAGEAAEALEQAHGVVELALLALLARNITVPT